MAGSGPADPGSNPGGAILTFSPKVPITLLVTRFWWGYFLYSKKIVRNVFIGNLVY
jgi:hypothetical protein